MAEDAAVRWLHPTRTGGLSVVNYLALLAPSRLAAVGHSLRAGLYRNDIVPRDPVWFERAKLSRHTEGTEFPRSSRDRRSRSLTKGAKRLSNDMGAARLPFPVHGSGGGFQALLRPLPWIVPPV